jgi:hypothetical protein
MQKTGYVSDITRFIRDFLDKNPHVVEVQKAARATWWDKKQDLELRERNEESHVPQTGYQYYDKPGVDVISGDPAPRDVKRET